MCLQAWLRDAVLIQPTYYSWIELSKGICKPASHVGHINGAGACSSLQTASLGVQEE